MARTADGVNADGRRGGPPRNPVSTAHLQGRPEWVTTSDGNRLFCRVLEGPSESVGVAPTVVFECGAAASRTSWAAVQPLVAGTTRAIVYDRAGLGRSEPAEHPPTLASMAAELGEVLDHFAPGPFVLVGHSAGGPIVRLTASGDPARVVGLVLVDPTDEAADMLFTRTFRTGERVVASIGVLAARLGLLPRLQSKLVAAAPPEVRDELRTDGMSPTTMRTARAAARTFLDDLHTWRTDPPDVGTIPTTVITGMLATDGMSRSMRAAATASHRVRAEALAAGRLVEARNSGHMIPFSEPELIVDEIRRLCEGSSA